MNSKEKDRVLDIPSWLVALITLALSSIAIFAFVYMEQQASSSSNAVYRLLTFVFIIVALGSGIVAIGSFIEDGKQRRISKSSEKRKQDYRRILKSLGGKRTAPKRRRRMR